MSKGPDLAQAGVASGKKGVCEYNCNTWAIKSTVQDKVLEFGNQRACELTNLSTRDVSKFLIASGVKITVDTVRISMKSKIDECVSASYSELLLGKNFLERRRNNQEFL